MAGSYSSGELKENFSKDVLYAFLDRENYGNFEELLLNALYAVREGCRKDGQYKFRMPNPIVKNGNTPFPLELVLLEDAGYVKNDFDGENYDPASGREGEGFAVITEKGERLLKELDRYDRMYSHIDASLIEKAMKKRKEKSKG